MLGNAVTELMECVDKLGYIVTCLNRTELNYIRGTKSTIYLAQQENYICLRETMEVDDQTYCHTTSDSSNLY